MSDSISDFNDIPIWFHHRMLSLAVARAAAIILNIRESGAPKAKWWINQHRSFKASKLCSRNNKSKRAEEKISPFSSSCQVDESLMWLRIAGIFIVLARLYSALFRLWRTFLQFQFPIEDERGAIEMGTTRILFWFRQVSKRNSKHVCRVRLSFIWIDSLMEIYCWKESATCVGGSDRSENSNIKVLKFEFKERSNNVSLLFPAYQEFY